MTITEKAAYLKGLVEGRGMDPETGEGKLWNVLSELVGDFAAELKELREDQEDLADSVETRMLKSAWNIWKIFCRTVMAIRMKTWQTLMMTTTMTAFIRLRVFHMLPMMT